MAEGLKEEERSIVEIDGHVMNSKEAENTSIKTIIVQAPRAIEGIMSFKTPPKQPWSRPSNKLTRHWVPNKRTNDILPLQIVTCEKTRKPQEMGHHPWCTTHRRNKKE